LQLRLHRSGVASIQYDNIWHMVDMPQMPHKQFI